MKRTQMLGHVAASLACLGMLLPTQLAQATEPTGKLAATAMVTDVALLPGGELRGQATTTQGVGVKDAAVSIWEGRRQVATTTTDETGAFRVTGLRGGMYRIAVGEGSGMFRLWGADTAPGAARPSALIVVDGEQVLGQGRLKHWLANPWVIAGIVAVAIAVPVAIHNRDPKSP